MKFSCSQTSFFCFEKKEYLHDKIASTERIFLYLESYLFEERSNNERVKFLKRYTREEYLVL